MVAERATRHASGTKSSELHDASILSCVDQVYEDVRRRPSPSSEHQPRNSGMFDLNLYVRRFHVLRLPCLWCLPKSRLERVIRYGKFTCSHCPVARRPQAVVDRASSGRHSWLACWSADTEMVTAEHGRHALHFHVDSVLFGNHGSYDKYGRYARSQYLESPPTKADSW